MARQKTGDFRIEMRGDAPWGVASFYGETIHVKLNDTSVKDLNTITSMILSGRFKLTKETKTVVNILKRRAIFHVSEIEK